MRSALLALTTAAFVTVLTEALPAGVLPGMSASLGVGESAAGPAATVYALGTALTAVPLSAASAAWPRKRLLLAGVAGFAVANTETAQSPLYPLTKVARFVAGVAAGVVWALLAGIAARVPDQPGRASARVPVRRTRTVPGVVPVLAVTLVFVLAHTVLYTYVAAFLGHAGMGDAVDGVLLVFGVASMAGIWVVGDRIERALRALTVLSTDLVAVAATRLAGSTGSPAPVYTAVALWGLGWGGVPTLLQTAAGNAGGDAADNAQAMLVTLWNAAMAAGGVLGGVLLDAAGPASFPWTLLVLLGPGRAGGRGARRRGGPAAAGAGRRG